MSAYQGDYDTTETVNLPFNTFSSDDPSASVTVTNLAAADIEIHKDGSVTQRASDAGVTVSIDFDGVTGQHMVHIDLSDNTDAGFYAAGSRYQVRLEGITVDAATLNVWIGSFSIGCVLRPATDGRTLKVDGDGLADANMVKVGPTGSGTAQTANDNGADINAILLDTGTDGVVLGADCITSAKIADDAISAEHLNTGALTADAFAADAIVAATLATNAISADGLAADAAVQIAAAVWDRVLTGATHNDATSAGRRLRELAAQVVRAGTAQAGAAGSITLDAAASATDQLYTGDVIIIVDGTGVGQSKTIVNYNGTTKVASIHGTWFVNPANDSDFVITASKDVQHTSHGFAQAGAAGSITLEAGASAVNDFYKAQEVHLVSGTGAEQARLITAYNGTTKVATVATNWATNPDATTVYHTLASAQVDAVLIEGGDATDAINAACDTAVSDYAGPTKAEMDTAHGLLATEAKQDIIDTNVDQIETAVITNAAGVDVAADIIALKTETATILTDTGTTLPAEHALLATEAKQDIIDTVVDAIKVQTDALPESIPRNDTFTIAFSMVDATDGYTLETGLTVTGTRSIDGGAFAAVTGAIAEIAASSGIYYLTGAAADSNGTEVVFKFASAGARTKVLVIRTAA